MNKEKLTYLSPETETLVVRFEGVICEIIPGSNINPIVYDDDPLSA